MGFGSVTNLGALSLVLGAAEGKSMFGLIGDPWLTMEPSLTALRDPDTQEVIPEGTASLVDLIKATIRSVYPERGDKTLDFRLREVASHDDGSADRNTMTTAGHFR